MPDVHEGGKSAMDFAYGADPGRRPRGMASPEPPVDVDVAANPAPVGAVGVRRGAD